MHTYIHSEDVFENGPKENVLKTLKNLQVCLQHADDLSE